MVNRPGRILDHRKPEKPGDTCARKTHNRRLFVRPENHGLHRPPRRLDNKKVYLKSFGIVLFVWVESFFPRAILYNAKFLFRSLCASRCVIPAYFHTMLSIYNIQIVRQPKYLIFTLHVKNLDTLVFALKLFIDVLLLNVGRDGFR